MIELRGTEFETTDDANKDERLRFGFGYALTVHKAQGSQWNRVFVLDESDVFEYHQPGKGRRWLYTAVTRAQRALTLLRFH